MTRKHLARVLRATLVIFTAVVASGGMATASPVFEYSGKYEVSEVKVLAEGEWQWAKKKAPGEFVFEFTPSWPQPMTVYVTWRSILDSHPNNPNLCQTMPSALDNIVLTRNGQNMPGHPTRVSDSTFTYAFANVPRPQASVVNASCKVVSSDWTKSWSSSGSATISFRPQDLLHDWNPGIAKPVLPGLASINEFLKPTDGETLPHGQPVAVQVKGKFGSPYSCPKKLQVELERAIKVQTGVVGEIALPDNQPYITWKPVTKLWVDVNWSRTGPSNYRGSFQMPSNLFSEGGLYHVHVVGAPAQWRTFKVKLPMMFRKVP